MNSERSIINKLRESKYLVSCYLIRKGDKSGNYMDDVVEASGKEEAIRLFKSRNHIGPADKIRDLRVYMRESCEEQEDLDEKTYTVGDKQYWRRAGKCYSWTADGGKKECSEDEYMKAISGGNNEPPKNTEPHEDKARDSGRTTNSTASVSGKDVVVDMNGYKYNATMEGMSPEELAKKYNDIAKHSPGKAIQWIKKNGHLEKVLDKPAESDDPTKWEDSKILNYQDAKKLAKAAKTKGAREFLETWEDYQYDEYVRISGMPMNVKRFKAMIDMYDEVEKEPEEDYEPSKRERDHSDSSRISYDGVDEFDHTTWDVDGYETQIIKNKDGSYYVQNEDFDREFPTKSDLVKYLKNLDASFAGYDSEKDY